MVPKLPLQLAGLLHTYHLSWWKRRATLRPFVNDWHRQHRAIFVHIPKTAGTSIFEAIEAPPAEDTHAPALAYRAAYPDLFAGAFKFAFVRNPWDRFASSYQFMKDGTDWPMQQEWAAKHIGEATFEEFTDRLRNPIFRQVLRSERFFWPQSFWITDRRGKVIVDRVYRFESLSPDIASVCAEIGLPAPKVVPHRRKSREVGYQGLYTSEMQKLVADFYREDIALLGYRF
jgi:hypothetical protein